MEAHLVRSLGTNPDRRIGYMHFDWKVQKTLEGGRLGGEHGQRPPGATGD